MKTIQLTYPHTLLKEELPKTVAAIGFFDGVHKGHQQVIRQAITKANQYNKESAVITFHPHPSVILRQTNENVKYITPLPKKQAILQQLKVDRLYVITFDEQLAQLEPQSFIDHFIIGLNIVHLVAGFDFTFGHKGKGNMDNISSLINNDFTYTKVGQVQLEDEKISSTKIRKLLSEGELNSVRELLGRPYTNDGIVVHGEKRGREIGFPTANLDVEEGSLLPKPGVYAVKVNYKNMRYKAMANLGTNPTFSPESEQLKLEVHMLDFDQQIYGEPITIEWHHFIRPEKKFASVDSLIEQMNMDKEITRKIFHM